VATTRGRLRPPSSAPSAGESVEILARGATWRIEQILSGELAQPVEDRLDHDEWVVVLAGAAVLDVDGVEVTMAEGEWIHLPAGVPHRVRSTARPTSWLAVHLGAGPAP